MLTVRLTIRELPPNADTAEGYNRVVDMPTSELAATGESYDEALAACRSQVPQGWQSIGIMVDRP